MDNWGRLQEVFFTVAHKYHEQMDGNGSNPNLPQPTRRSIPQPEENAYLEMLRNGAKEFFSMHERSIAHAFFNASGYEALSEKQQHAWEFMCEVAALKAFSFPEHRKLEEEEELVLLYKQQDERWKGVDMNISQQWTKVDFEAAGVVLAGIIIDHYVQPNPNREQQAINEIETIYRIAHAQLPPQFVQRNS